MSKKIVYGVDNMARLVSNLLDLGRIETGIGFKKFKKLLRMKLSSRY